MGLLKKIALAAVLLAVPSVWAWGPGHDVVGRCVLKKLPPEWQAKFKPEWARAYDQATHLPDNGNPKLLKPEELDWLKENCELKGGMYALHKGLPVYGEFERLVNAIRTGDDYSVFICHGFLAVSAFGAMNAIILRGGVPSLNQTTYPSRAATTSEFVGAPYSSRPSSDPTKMVAIRNANIRTSSLRVSPLSQSACRSGRRLGRSKVRFHVRHSVSFGKPSRGGRRYRQSECNL